MELKLITKENIYKISAPERTRWQEDYLVMYSSQWQGFTTDLDLMAVPFDDHLVHRGDGVFEVMRCVCGKVYQMEKHLERLGRSARAIALEFPPEYDNIRDIIRKLVILGGERDCVIRIVISRGAGSFNVNPYDCPSSCLYANVLRFKGMPDEYYSRGVALVTSSIPVKKSFFANIKSCNYLQNALMKKEAVDAGCEFSVALDEDGCLAEGSTENVGVLGEDNILRFPAFERTLSGITAGSILRLAKELVSINLISDVKFAKITPHDAYQAKEIFLTGTSLDVLPVIKYDKKLIDSGIPGPICSELSKLLWRDMISNKKVLTEVF